LENVNNLLNAQIRELEFDSGGGSSWADGLQDIHRDRMLLLDQVG
jgi:hypothetical protein